VIHGYRTIFPIPLGLASTCDSSAVESMARISASDYDFRVINSG
jgi:beta-glucosidase